MRIVVHPHYTHVADFVQLLPTLFANEGELLYDKRNKIRRFYMNGEPIIVKKFKQPHLIQRITYTFFKKSKAERAYLYAAKLREQGFETPHEIAFIEIKSNGLFTDSYFVSTECRDASMKQLLNKEHFEEKPADELAAYLAKLHQKGILHGDINLSNILYRIEDGQYFFTLIDTNRSQFIPSPSVELCIENLKRLTHHKQLLEYVVRKYAVIRGWSPEICTSKALQYLEAFETKIEKKRKLHSLLGLKKK